MGILSGLASLGLGNLESAKLYEEEKKAEAPVKPEVKKKVELKEEDYLFEKTYTCPVCEAAILNPTLRTNRMRRVGADDDLRPIYEGIDIQKYDTIMCEKCGFTAIGKYFKSIPPTLKKQFMEQIGNRFQSPQHKLVLSYEDALARYKLAIASAIVKRAKPSEKAYICLKTGWLLRGWAENLPQDTQDREKMIAALKKEEEEYLANALEGFLAARASEPFPLCGMDENTFDYLLAQLSVHFKKYDQASQLVSKLLGSKTASTHIKNKSLELKEVILAGRKE